ncbi:MAG TPA: tRNA (guanosine(46)-N7)-methyltransferase TrmB [Steroidobacteraceae bacterium]|nr:tRNA (guanosine(46)-N7)-methyltransferase TrmB [Steroidobacteraceae bacterium]
MSDDQDHSNKPAEGVSRRGVKSFVIRAGRSTAAQQRALEQLWPKYGIEYSDASLDLNAVFARHAPRMIEIGFGAGEALLAFAQRHPEIDCLGIEVHPPGVGRLLHDIELGALTNVRVSMHDAVEVLGKQIPAGSIDLIHIFFPDPWPKKRHHKRRLIQPPFADLLAHALRIDGTLRLATDWEPYAIHMREVLDVHPAFKNSAGSIGYAARNDERPLTRFERRGHRLGHGVWDLEYRRVPTELLAAVRKI